MRPIPPFIIFLIGFAWSLPCRAGETKTADDAVYYKWGDDVDVDSFTYDYASVRARTGDANVQPALTSATKLPPNDFENVLIPDLKFRATP
ncbi:MAG: hypothetical protein WCD79_05225 [Chthoniobacteraceae bacterium]